MTTTQSIIGIRVELSSGSIDDVLDAMDQAVLQSGAITQDEFEPFSQALSVLGEPTNERSGKWPYYGPEPSRSPFVYAGQRYDLRVIWADTITAEIVERADDLPSTPSAVYGVERSTRRLVAEGFDRRAVDAAWNSLIEAGSSEMEQTTDHWLITEAELDVLRDQLRASARDDVRAATEERATALADLERRWRESIRRAVAAGIAVTEVARLAGISRERVYQIRDGRR